MKHPHYRRNADDLYQFNETDPETGASVPITGAEPLAEAHALFDTATDAAVLLQHGSPEAVSDCSAGLAADRKVTLLTTRHTEINAFNRQIFSKTPKSKQILQLAANKVNV